MLFQLLILCACLVTLLIYVEAKARRTAPSCLPNGPRPWLWSLGNLWLVHQLNTHPRRICAGLAHSYGDMTTYWVGQWPTILINSPEDAYELLQKRAASTSSRPTHSTVRQDLCPDRVVFTPTGNDFRRLRKVYHCLLQRQEALKARKAQDDESIHLLCALSRDPKKFILHSDRFAINILFQLLYDERLDSSEDAQMITMYKTWATMYLHFVPGSLPTDIIPSLANLPGWIQPWKYFITRLLNRESVLHKQFLDRLKRRLVAGAQTECFARSVLDARSTAVSSDDNIDIINKEKKQKAHIESDEAILNILAMVTGAGSDTVSAVLQIFFKVVASFPEKAALAQGEIDGNVGDERLPMWRDWETLPYTRALIKELQRWAPIAVIGLPHATTEEIRYREYVIPKGTILLPNIPALSRHKLLYKDPNTFDPTRFLGDDRDSSASALLTRYQDRDHFQYGFGRRLCPGVHIAETSLFIVVARILWAFDISQIPGRSISMEHERSGLIKKPLAFDLSIVPRSRARVEVLESFRNNC